MERLRSFPAVERTLRAIQSLRNYQAQRKKIAIRMMMGIGTPKKNSRMDLMINLLDAIKEFV